MIGLCINMLVTCCHVHRFTHTNCFCNDNETNVVFASISIYFIHLVCLFELIRA